MGANFREAQRAQTDADFISKLAISLKELEESAYWLESLEETKIYPPELLVQIRDEPRQLEQSLLQFPKRINGYKI